MKAHHGSTITTAEAPQITAGGDLARMQDRLLVGEEGGGLVAAIRRAQALSTEGAERGHEHRRHHTRDGTISAASFYVPTLPGASSSGLALPHMYSGHLPASYALSANSQDVLPAIPDDAQSDAHLFFLLVKARHVANRQKLVIWFNGGPGCSSFDGALLEVGPVTVHGTGSSAQLRDNPGKWNEYANVLFVDQPAGTGYSYINNGRPVHELAPAAEQVVSFLANFYSVFPEYKAADTYLAGESYAGTTIPYLASAIAQSKTMPDTLRGLLIGNGWFSPTWQYPGYVEYAESRGFLKNKNSNKVKNVFSTMDKCNRDLNSTAGAHHILVGSCEGLIGAVMDSAKATIDQKKECINAYDVRPSSFCGEYPNGLQYTTPYLRQSNVLDSFHAEAKGAPWKQCNDTVGSQMWSPKSRPSIELLPELLKSMSVLLFAGDADFMCNWIGIEQSIKHLTWRGEMGFGANVTASDWYVNGTLAGTWTEDRNLTWVVVKEAGHMVPIDQPLAAHDILLRFIGIDPLTAAGAGSKVPSNIGIDAGGVLGKIAPDGDTLDAVKSELDKQAAAKELAEDAAVDKADEEGQPIDKERELLYGPRRSAVLLTIIVAVSLAVYGLLRWRARQRRRQGWMPKHLENKHLSVARSDSAYRLGKLATSPPASRKRDRTGGSDSPLSPASAGQGRQRWKSGSSDQVTLSPALSSSGNDSARILFTVEDDDGPVETRASMGI